MINKIIEAIRAIIRAIDEGAHAPADACEVAFEDAIAQGNF